MHAYTPTQVLFRLVLVLGMLSAALIYRTAKKREWWDDGGFGMRPTFTILLSMLFTVPTVFIFMANTMVTAPQTIGDLRVAKVGFNHEGHIVHLVRPEDGLVWSQGYTYIPVPYEQEFAGEVSPITSNPKVRHLQFTLRVQIQDYDAFFVGIGRPSAHDDDKDKKTFQRRAMGELLEFTNATSKELAEFYNPYDDGQTQRLEALIMDRLNPRLAPKGMKMTKLVSWTVN